MHEKPSNSAGVTLLELLLVLSIISTTTVLGSSVWKALFQNTAIETSTSEVSDFITHHFLIAQASRQTTPLEFDLEKQIIHSTNSSYKFSSHTKLDTARFGSLRSTPNTLLLYPNGTSSPGKIRITSGSTYCEITISLWSALSSRCEKQ